MVAGLLPDHYGELHEQLENLRRDIQRGQGEGIPAPTILVDGDVGGDVAAVFQLAGADVATCGLAVKPMRGLPHFEGDPSLVQNQGWDLVISFPNLADVERDGRREEVLRARRHEALVSTFLERCNAEAPFRAVQQPETPGDPPMGMQPSQSIRPWEYGQDEMGCQETSEWHLLGGIPLLRPTRSRPDGRVAPAHDKSLPRRAAAGVGVAGVMALQWMPAVRSHQREQVPRNERLAADEMVRRATATLTQKASEVVFYRIGSAGVEVYGGQTLLGAVRGGRDEDRGDVTPGSTAIRVASEELTLPVPWARALRREALGCPSGHASLLLSTEPGEMLDLCIWAVEVEGKESSCKTPPRRPHCQGQLADETPVWRSSETPVWRSFEETVRELQKGPSLRYADALERALARHLSSARLPERALARPLSSARPPEVLAVRRCDD